MNGFERITDALEGKQPDTTPIMLHNFMLAAREAGFTQAQYRENPHNIAESFIKAVEKYQYDGIVVDVDTVTLAGAVGVLIDFPEMQPATSFQGLINNIQDIKYLKPIDIEKYKYVQIWLEAVRILKEYFKNELYIRGNCDQAPFSLASIIRTPQEWVMDLYESEELAFQLLEFCCDVTCRFIGLMAQTGADMLSNGDSPAGPEMISPQLYSKYALPFEKRVIDHAHSYGKDYALHICGDTSDILGKMIKTGTDAIDLDYKTNLRYAHNLLKNKIVFIGNLDPSGVLAKGTVEQVQQKTEELIQVYYDSPRFILNAGCAIPDSTPEKNLKTMIKTARMCKR